MYECNLTRWCCWWGCVKKHIDDDYPVDIAFHFIRSYMCKMQCCRISASFWRTNTLVERTVGHFISLNHTFCLMHAAACVFSTNLLLVFYQHRASYVITDCYMQIVRIFHLCIFLGKSKSFYYRIIVTESYMCGWYDDACLAVLV